MKKIAILQSNYIPWKGYFDLINKVDEFIFYDEVQYTKRDWRNRNKIKTQQGAVWISIPVNAESRQETMQPISAVPIAERTWCINHWEQIRRAYSKCPFFQEYSETFHTLYQKCQEIELLCEVNYLFIESICDILGIKTKLTQSRDYELIGDRSQRLMNLVLSAGGGHYLSGPAAKSYLDEKLFAENNISVEWMCYDGYPEYDQRFPPFEHGVTILDLIFNVGKKAPDYMLSFG